MAYFTDTNAAVAAQPSRTAAFFDAIALKIRQRKVYRKTFDELCTMTQRDLADLGLSRGDFRRLSKEVLKQLNNSICPQFNPPIGLRATKQHGRVSPPR